MPASINHRCDAFIRKLDNGYDTIVGSAGSHLSGGERQRIAIARAMLKNAPIIILDEATSSVDPENEDELQRAIEALTHDKTIIMIAHRLKTVRNAGGGGRRLSLRLAGSGSVSDGVLETVCGKTD